jgi:hypothetical protein
MILFGGASLQRRVREHLSHYHCEPNHQGLDNRLIIPDSHAINRGPVRRRERLGGMLNYFFRQAARDHRNWAWPTNSPAGLQGLSLWSQPLSIKFRL